MWLLSTDRAELHYFPRNFDATGGYAILSHTWDKDGEQTLKDVQAIAKRCLRNGSNPRDSVHPKIRNCCIVAEKHGYRWVWIDSCCIDKTSSSELSEAINSMFRWYKEAEVCFAYLADVPGDCDLHADDSAFRKSRWHTRGWTLQELIAPDFLIFLSAEWHELGNRADLAGLLEQVTGVPSGVLVGDDTAAEYSISTRMSWASTRKATRVEDEAYCLMGLFGVSMPTNYSEGKKAFIRLQYEIMQHNPDMSLFVFGYCVHQDHNFTFYPEEVPSHSWKYLMADSPGEFYSTFAYIPDLGTNTKQQYPPPLDSEATGPFEGGVKLPRLAVTSYGIELRVPIHEADGFTIAVILCQWNGHHFGLFLTRDEGGKDPTRPRYFTSCIYTDPEQGSARYNARLVDLGDDLYDLTFNGKPVKASWRTIYVVPTAPDWDSGRSTMPNLIMNCNPTSRFRVPRWLVARFIALQFNVEQLMNEETLQLLDFVNSRLNIGILVTLSSCTTHRDHDRDGPPLLWAKVDVKSPIVNTDQYTHDCFEDHIDSESWATRSKVFGEADYEVRLSLTPSTRMPDSLHEVHLELIGHVFQELLKEVGNPSMFPSLTDLEREKPHIAPDDPAPPSRTRTPLKIDATSGPQTPPPPSSSTHSSTSTIASLTSSSRNPRLVSRSPPNAGAQGRPQESDDAVPQPEESQGSERQGEDASLLQIFSPMLPTASLHPESGASGDSRVGTNKEGLADSQGVECAMKDSDRQRRPGQGKKFSGVCKRWLEAWRRRKTVD